MFTLFVIIGGGLLWNAVNSIGSIMSNGQIDFIVTVIGMVFIVALVDGLLVINKGGGSFVHTAVQAQLGLWVLIAACLVTASYIRGNTQGLGVLIGIIVVCAVIYFVASQGVIPAEVNGTNANNGGATDYLRSMGLDPAHAYTNRQLAKNYLDVSFGSTAVVLALLAIPIGYGLTVAFDKMQPLPRYR